MCDKKKTLKYLQTSQKLLPILILTKITTNKLQQTNAYPTTLSRMGECGSLRHAAAGRQGPHDYGKLRQLMCPTHKQEKSFTGKLSGLGFRV